MCVKSRVAAMMEFLAVVFSSFVVGSGTGFLEAIPALRGSLFGQLATGRGLLLGAAGFGGVIASVIGALVYYLFLRPGLSVREASLIILASLLIGVPSTFLGPLCMLITPMVTFFSAGYVAGLRAHEDRSSSFLGDVRPVGLALLNQRFRTFFHLTGELISVTVCGLIVGLGLGVLSITEVPIRDDATRRVLCWGLAGVGFVPGLYYLVLRNCLTMAVVAVLIPCCGVVTIVSASILPETRQTGSLLLTGAAALLVSLCARIRRRRSA